MKKYSEFVETILEAKKTVMTPNALFLKLTQKKKDPSYVGKNTNMSILFDMVEKETISVNGEAKSLTNALQVSQQIKAALHSYHTGDKVQAMKTIEEIQFATRDGSVDIYKIDMNGLTTDASRAGANKYNQSLQCIVLAAYANKILPTVSNAPKLAAYVKLGTVSVRECIKIADREWIESATATTRVLAKAFNLTNKIFIEESDPMSAAIYAIASSFKGSVSGDRWNPADIWIAASDFSIDEISDVTSLAELKERMQGLYDENRLIGVSLKQVVRSQKGKKAKSAVVLKNHFKRRFKKLKIEFSVNPTTFIRADKPLYMNECFKWDAISAPGNIITTTYGAKNADRFSGLFFGVRSSSGGRADGQITGRLAYEFLNEVGGGSATAATASELRDGYIGNKKAFWNTFYKYWKESSKVPLSLEQLKDYCYTNYPVKDGDYDSKNWINKGNLPFITYANCEYVYHLQKLSEEKQIEVLKKIYFLSSSEDENSTVHLVCKTK